MRGSQLELISKYHTYSPSFSHDSRDLIPHYVCFFKFDTLRQDDVSCIVFYCASDIEIFGKLLLCLCSDLMLKIFRTHIHFFFSCMKQVTRSETTMQRWLRRLWRRTRRCWNWFCRVSITHTLSPSFSHDSRFDLASCVCTTVKRTKRRLCETHVASVIFNREVFLLQLRFPYHNLSCVVFYCVSDFANCFEILFVCCVCCFDVILWLFFLLTFNFLLFFCFRVWNS